MAPSSPSASRRSGASDAKSRSAPPHVRSAGVCPPPVPGAIGPHVRPSHRACLARTQGPRRACPRLRHGPALAMRDVIARLEGTEQRIERLLASGWRARGAEADALAAEADALDTIGLTALAARLRAVAGAADAPA